MNDRIKLFLNCDDELQKRIKIFIEYFVRYYGEDKREEIEKKLSQATYIGYIPPRARARMVDKLKENQSELIQREIIDKTEIPLEINDLFGGLSFENEKLLPLHKLAKLKEIHDKGPKQRLREFIDSGYEFTSRYFEDMTKIKYLSLKTVDDLPKKTHPLIENTIRFFIDRDNSENDYKESFKEILPLLEKIDPNITFEGLEEFFQNDKVKHLLAMYETAKEQYNLFLEENKDIFSTQEQNEKIDELLKEKYYLLYLEENIDLIPEKERQPLYDFINGKTKNFFGNEYINTILGYTLNSTSILEYFNEENDQVLEENSQEWRIDTIKEKRVKYFKTIGIDLGKEYESYVNDSECRAKWPTKELIERVINSKNKYHNKFNNEYFEKIVEYKKIRERIDKLDLLDKEDGFNAKLLTDSGTFINPNIRLTDQGYDTHSLFVICFDNINSDTSDHNIVHELNHLFELELLSINGNKYELLVGWDYASGEIEQQKNTEVDTINIKKTKRSYELFNEIINELIAQDICEMMHKDNVTVFDEPNNSRYKRTTSYEDYLVLVQDFFKEFKDKILESRKAGNIKVIYEAVGEENFDELNNLIKFFYENYKEMKIYSLRRALNNNEDNEMTRTYYEIIEKRDAILDKMRNYKIEDSKTM